MTYSGLLMLVIGAAMARSCSASASALGRAGRCRRWSSPWRSRSRAAPGVGACAAAALLLTLKDFRLLAVLPIVGAICSPSRRHRITQRAHVDVRPERSDQRAIACAMMHEGEHMIATIRSSASARTWSQRLYAQYRDPGGGRSRSIRTCTTCRCRSPPSAACRRSRSGSRSSSSLARDLCRSVPDEPIARAGGRRRWRRSSRCSPPACSSTTSATPSS